ncbi:MAG: DMT family transporter [Hyphomicrobiaceae bacterium]
MANTPVQGSSLKGILSMALAAMILTLHDTLTKILLETYPINQIVLVRQGFSLLILVVVVHATVGWKGVGVVNRTAVAWRAIAFAATTVLIVASLSVLPVAIVLALVFASPLIVAALSVPFLGETVGRHRWAAILAGFIGILIILRPFSSSFDILLVLPVAASIAAGCRDVVTRWAGRTDSPLAILFWSNAAAVTLALFTVSFGWISISATHLFLLLVVAGLNTAAHFLMIVSLRLADAALVSPLRYTALVWAVILGYLIWGYLPDNWTFFGASIVICSSIYLGLREARLHKRTFRRVV